VSAEAKTVVPLHGECPWHGRQAASHCIFAGLIFECECKVSHLHGTGWIWTRKPEKPTRQAILESPLSEG